MTSKIVVNNIQTDAGISSVTLLSHVAGHDSTQNISGINSVTATSFHGDGSNLTSLPAANLTGTLPAISGANLTGIVALPAGMIAPFAMTTPPTGWLECNGAAISRSTYATLFAAIGTVHGAGDGSSTFNLPDLRASFIRGFDNSRGVDSGRSFGSFQDQGLPAMKGRVQDSHGQAAINSSQEGSFTNVFTNGGGQSTYRSALQVANTSYKYVLFDSTNVIPDASAGGLRPKNLALMYMIKI